MLRGHIEPDTNAIVNDLAAKLMALLPKGGQLADVEFKEQKTRHKRFTGHELVKVMTANDGSVCKACLEIAAGGPYHYSDIRAQIPHHPGCRCYLKRVGAEDTGFLTEHPHPTFKQFKRALKAHVMPRVKRRRKAVGTPQRNAAIARLRKGKKKFVAPHGIRAVRRQAFLNRMGRRWTRKPKKD